MDFEIQLWTEAHDCSQLRSSFFSIQKYIQDQAARAVSSRVSDVEEPSADDLADGARDPMGFYIQYGFIALPKTPRTVFKRLSTIEKELKILSMP